MAILCLARDLTDLRQRLSRVVVAYDTSAQPVTAADLKAVGAMMALLKDAFQPNLVQTLEHNPVLIHGGPFANIAHGCSSVRATRAALRLADYVVTEAGFGADLGAEKFFDIKCRQAGLSPAAAVVVATVRALKMHGGAAQEQLTQADPAAVARGCVNLLRHIDNVRRFNVPVIVAVNRFNDDTSEELEEVRKAAAQKGVPVALCSHWAEGGKGAQALAKLVCAEADAAGSGSAFVPLYPDAMPLEEKIRAVAQRIYGARDIDVPGPVRKQLQHLTQLGHGDKPVCIAKTQYSFSTDATRRGAPVDHIVPVRDVRLAAGAGFVVVLCADIMTMPGLPRQPAAERIDVDADGQITGLF